MRTLLLFVGVAFFLAGFSNGINILLNNDDGFGSGNLRELYKLLKAAGHNVWIVAPALPQSGQGGRSDFTTEANLTGPSQYDLIPEGAPSVGPDPMDSHIWYYNGTPAACTFVALDYVLPNFGDFKVPDLVVTGPNYGTNVGPFVWTLSGTAGAAYAATARSIPAIATSGSNKAVPYYEVNSTSHPAALVAAVAAKVVLGVIDSVPEGAAIFPLGYGMNVNIPPLSANFTSPPIVQTRMTGNAEVDEAIPGDTPGTFTWANIRPYQAGVNACYNGDCSLPGETYVVTNGQVAVSLYTVDYTAPTNGYTKSIISRLKSLESTS